MKNILEYLERAAEAFPKKCSFCDNITAYTYLQLMLESKAIGSYLLKCRIPKAPVAVLLDKSPLCLSALMGVVYAGDIYAILDPHMPSERMAYIHQTLSPAAILTDRIHECQAREIGAGIPVFLIEDASACPINDAELSVIRKQSIDTDPVYILFTSGSTGVPKGTVVCHRSILTYSNWAVETFGFSKDTVFGNQTPFFFSMSVLDIFSTLNCAATMYIIPTSLFSFPLRLIETLQTHDVNTIYWVPSALSVLSNCKAFEYAAPPTLRTILFAGEVMPAKVLNYWIAHLPEAVFANLYGPTEVTDICTYYVVDRPFENWESIPIGKACDNCGVMLINSDGNEAQTGEEGEIYVRGSFLALGYYNDPQRTAEVFAQNPLNRRYPEPAYKTGDLGRFNERGELLYIARKDNQIKHMGYRIELGEIEAASGAADGLERCAATYDAQADQILLFYQGSSLDEKVLDKALRTRLPKYMLPAKLIRIKQMPYNRNGKIDRSKLESDYKSKQPEVTKHE